MAALNTLPRFCSLTPPPSAFGAIDHPTRVRVAGAASPPPRHRGHLRPSRAARSRQRGRRGPVPQGPPRGGQEPRLPGRHGRRVRPLRRGGCTVPRLTSPPQQRWRLCGEAWGPFLLSSSTAGHQRSPLALPVLTFLSAIFLGEGRFRSRRGLWGAWAPSYRFEPHAPTP